jgi:hypothetical protein
MEYWAGATSQRAVESIKTRSKKIELFLNEDDFTKDVYLRVTRSLGTLLLVIIGFGFGFYLNTLIFSVLLSLIFIEYVFFCVYWRYLQDPKRYAQKVKFNKSRNDLLRNISTANFYAGFALVVLVFFQNPDFGVYNGILCFLLTRQIMQRIFSRLQDAFALYSNKSKINVLFYTNIHYNPPVVHFDKSFVHFVQPENLDNWIHEILRTLPFSVLDRWAWVDVAGKNIGCLAAPLVDDDSYSVFVKIFGADQKMSFEQEKLVLQQCSTKSQIFPDFLCEYSFSTFNFLIYKAPALGRRKEKEPKEIMLMVRAAVMSVQLENRFVSLCQRTKPLLAQRITKNKLNLLYVSANSDEEKQAVDQLLASYDHYVDTLASVPPSLLNPDINPYNLMKKEDGTPTLIAWHRWTMEPLGAGLPLHLLEVSDVEVLLDHMSRQRDDMENINCKMIMLVAYSFHLDNSLVEQNFRKAIELVPSILECLDD